MTFTHFDKARFIHAVLTKYDSDMKHRAANGRVKNVSAVRNTLTVMTAVQTDYD